MKLKHWLLGAVSTIAVLAAMVGVQPTSWGVWYQPKAPEELLRR